MKAPPAGNGFTQHPSIVRHWFTASGALVALLQPEITAVAVFSSLAAGRLPLFLDSALHDTLPASTDSAARAAVDDGTPSPTLPRLGRYSFVASDPIYSLQLDATYLRRDAEHVSQAFATLRALLSQVTTQTIPGLPPFQGGFAGMVSYDCGLSRLNIDSPPHHTDHAASVPLISLHLYDVVWAFDHDLQRGWIISQGLPAPAPDFSTQKFSLGPAARRLRASQRLESLLAQLTPVQMAPISTGAPPRGEMTGTIQPLAAHPALCSTHSQQSYLEMVRAGIELVRAGDIFQVNLSQRFTVAHAIAPATLYLQARSTNPAPFASYFDCGAVQIVSMSPERLLQVERGTVRMHPIKGTRRMIASPEADLYAGNDLEASVKDRAENVMIVDLVRSDLSRVCTPQSVQVTALCRLERFRYVQHLVSIVTGRLRQGFTAVDVLDATTPGGSVTGAPKHRACEIIAALETVPRGAYCGSLGYIGLDGAADFNLLIRTFVVEGGRIEFSVGGGITAQSDPAAEYDETLHKAEGLLRVLESLGLTGPRPPATPVHTTAAQTAEQAATQAAAQSIAPVAS